MSSFTGTRSEKFEVFLELLSLIDPEFVKFSVKPENWILDPYSHDWLQESDNFPIIRSFYKERGFDITPELFEEFVTVDLYE